MRPVVADTELDLLSLAISLAYPIGDLILIGVAMGLLTTPGARTASFALLGGESRAAGRGRHDLCAADARGHLRARQRPRHLYLVSYVLFGASRSIRRCAG